MKLRVTITLLAIILITSACSTGISQEQLDQAVAKAKEEQRADDMQEFNRTFKAEVDKRVAAIKADTAAQSAKNAGSFTIGSTMDEVKTLMGTPDKIDVFGRLWFYGDSTITFGIDNKVQEYNNRGKNLKIK